MKVQKRLEKKNKSGKRTMDLGVLSRMEVEGGFWYLHYY